MRLLRGHLVTEDADPARGAPRVVEHDTFTCAHCGTVVPIPFRCSPADAGGWCWKCDTAICGQCADNGNCVPTEERLLREERAITANLQREFALRSYGPGR